MKNIFTLLFSLPLFINAQNSFTPSGAGKIPAGYQVNNIFSLNQDEIWASASSITGNQPAIILITRDNGNNWSVSKPDSNRMGYCDDLHVVNSKVAYVVLEDLNGDDYIYRTSNGGITWKNTSFSYGLYVYASSPASVVVLGAATGWYSNDSFNTSTTVPWNNGGPPSFTPFGFNAFSGTQAKFVSDSGLFFGYSKGSIVRTQNMGHTWKAFRTTLDSTGATSSIACSGNTILALRRYLTNKGGLSRSADGGRTWVNKSDSIPSSAGIQTISSIASKPNYFLLGGYNNILRSTDGGLSWKNTTIPTSVKSSGAIHIAGVSNAWLGGDVDVSGDAPLYRIDIRDNPSSLINSDINSFNLFPNPTKDILYFDAAITGHLIITDINGRTIMETNTGTGKNSIDISALPSSIYFIHYSNETISVVKKLVKQGE